MTVVVDLNCFSFTLLPYGWPLHVYTVSVVGLHLRKFLPKLSSSPLIAFFFSQRHHKKQGISIPPLKLLTSTHHQAHCCFDLKRKQPIFQFFKAVKFLLLPTFLFFFIKLFRISTQQSTLLYKGLLSHKSFFIAFP